jgi:SAM-dependent methyltransferase
MGLAQRWGTAGLVLVGAAGHLAAQRAGAPAFPAPDRPVAPIVSPSWNSETARDREGEARQVFDLLGLRSGMRVADIGAGSGYYTVRLAQRLGPGSVVYAEDIEATYLAQLQGRLEREGVRGVTLVLGGAADPELPPASVDVALLSHMYHEIADPYEFLYNLAGAIAPGGRVAVVDVDRSIARHGTPAALLRCEMAAMGYRELSTARLAEGAGYLAVFSVPAHPTEPGRIRVCRAPE